MAKQTAPQNKALEADVLKAAGTQASTTAAEGTGENKVNQDTVKSEATKLTEQAQGEAKAQEVKGTEENTTGPVARGEQLPGSNLPPVNEVQGKAGDDWNDDAKDANIKAENAARVAPQPNAPFNIPQYLQTNPVQNQEEIDAIATFLEGYRNKSSQAETAKLAQADDHAALVKKYGEGYVKAKKGNQEQVFTAITWQRMNGNSNQDGWRQVVNTPPEVAALKKGS